MSVYLCGERHISAVATIVAQNPGMHLLLGSIFDQLVMDNVASLQARYPHNPDTWEGYDEYCVQLAKVDLKTTQGKAQALKALNCYSYQACESEGWEKSDSYQWVESAIAKLEKTVSKESSAYQSAEWGF